jgi:small GTP-binding protein
MMDGSHVPHYKIVILGNSGCGKTAIILRWVSGTFPEASNPTIGSNHQRKRILLGPNRPVDLYVWDTAGQEQFQSLTPLYTRSASLAIVTVAIDDESSFNAIPRWITTVTSSCEVPPPVVLAVNKMDLRDSAVFTMDQVHTRWDSEFAGIFFVSALTGESVDQLFEFAAGEAAKFSTSSTGTRPQTVADIAKVEGSGCC